MMERTCLNCGIDFRTQSGPSRIKTGRGKFCSQVCQLNYLHILNTFSQKDKFWEYVEKSEGCWNWKGPHNDKGYGQINAEKKTSYAHRFSWILHNGPITNGLIVCHHCDNPSCVRPDHLFLGTHKDNNADMLSKHRENFVQGENVGCAKLTNEQAEEIRKSYRRGVKGYGFIAIGRRFNVSPNIIMNIVLGRTYKAGDNQGTDNKPQMRGRTSLGRNQEHRTEAREQLRSDVQAVTLPSIRGSEALND